jgi:hypothetical protein
MQTITRSQAQRQIEKFNRKFREGDIVYLTEFSTDPYKVWSKAYLEDGTKAVAWFRHGVQTCCVRIENVRSA